MTKNSRKDECMCCGKYVDKIWRVYRKIRYCGTCYAREFKQRVCSKCGLIARLPIFDPEAVCGKCKNDKPCIRCGKPKFSIGKITEYGPACKSCSIYFKKPEPCESCGKESTRLSRDLSSDQKQKLCPSCRNKNFSSCTQCKRHRQLFIHSDGSKQCKKCLTYGEVPCMQCDSNMPAGRGKICEQCYWSNLLIKKTNICAMGFTSTLFGERFQSYSSWLVTRLGNHKAAIVINRYYSFFKEIEELFQVIPSYIELLDHFSASGLRKFLLPVLWMAEFQYIIISEIEREENSDLRRIAKQIDFFEPLTKASKLVNQYYQYLLKKQDTGKTSVRSIRLALTPVISFFKLIHDMSSLVPDQNNLNTYLLKSPGQRAAISGFIGFLNNHCDINVEMPTINEVKRKKDAKVRLESEMQKYLKTSNTGEDSNNHWKSLALAYFHGLPKMHYSTVNDLPCIEASDGLLITVKKLDYWIPLVPKERI